MLKKTLDVKLLYLLYLQYCKIIILLRIIIIIGKLLLMFILVLPF